MIDDIEKLAQKFHSIATNDNEELTYDLPLSVLEEWDPFDNVIWAGLNSPITKEEIKKSIQQNNLKSNPIPEFDFNKEPTSRTEHVKRIAYLVINKCSDPIEIDVGVPELGVNVSWIITDGNHRLAAAFYRSDQIIKANISGSLDHAEELFNIKIQR